MPSLIDFQSINPVNLEKPPNSSDSCGNITSGILSPKDVPAQNQLYDLNWMDLDLSSSSDEDDNCSVKETTTSPHPSSASRSLTVATSTAQDDPAPKLFDRPSPETSSNSTSAEYSSEEDDLEEVPGLGDEDFESLLNAGFQEVLMNLPEASVSLGFDQFPSSSSPTSVEPPAAETFLNLDDERFLQEALLHPPESSVPLDLDQFFSSSSSSSSSDDAISSSVEPPAAETFLDLDDAQFNITISPHRTNNIDAADSCSQTVTTSTAQNDTTAPVSFDGPQISVGSTTSVGKSNVDPVPPSSFENLPAGYYLVRIPEPSSTASVTYYGVEDWRAEELLAPSIVLPKQAATGVGNCERVESRREERRNSSTRFRPYPPTSSNVREGGEKRKRNVSNVRTVFNAEHNSFLEEMFSRGTHYLSPVEREALARNLGVRSDAINNWFKNKRARLARNRS